MRGHNHDADKRRRAVIASGLHGGLIRNARVRFLCFLHENRKERLEWIGKSLNSGC